jgi:hypothetical protein
MGALIAYGYALIGEAGCLRVFKEGVAAPENKML